MRMCLPISLFAIPTIWPRFKRKNKIAIAFMFLWLLVWMVSFLFAFCCFVAFVYSVMLSFLPLLSLLLLFAVFFFVFSFTSSAVACFYPLFRIYSFSYETKSFDEHIGTRRAVIYYLHKTKW